MGGENALYARPPPASKSKACALSPVFRLLSYSVYFFLSLGDAVYGMAKIYRDPAEIMRVWRPSIGWYSEGDDFPLLCRRGEKDETVMAPGEFFFHFEREALSTS